MPLIQEILEHSGIFEDIREEGRAKGRAEGREEGRAEGIAEGRVEECRKNLRLALRSRFPDLEQAPEIDQIADSERLSALFEVAITATDREAVVKAMAAAVISN